jgi:hypothetical protein
MSKRIQFAFGGDTTASMGYLREEIRRAMERESKRLARDFPGIEIAAMFFGDDMCRHEVYPIRVNGFTTDVESTVNFIRRTPNTYGGGPHANYERALYEARLLKWDDDAHKVLVIIGDEVPHAANFKHNDGSSYDWRSELRFLVKMGVKVCGLHCLPGVRPASKRFYEEIAHETGGSYLTLDQFNGIGDLILAVIYHEMGNEHLKRFEDEVQGAGRMTRNADRNFATLGHRHVAQRYASDTVQGLRPVPAGQLQILWVDQQVINILEPTRRDGVSIGKFLPHHGFELSMVKRYYQFTKPETVQEYKDVVLYDKATGDFFTGKEARKLLGLPEYGDVRIKPQASILAKYDVFIETGSNNRKLLPNTRVLVDVSQRKSKR